MYRYTEDIKKMLQQIHTKVKEKVEEEKGEEVEYIEYEPNENEQTIVKTLKEAGLFQLSPHVIFCVSCMLGNVSLIIFGPTGSGKTKIKEISARVIKKFKRGDAISDAKGLAGIVSDEDEVLLTFDDLTRLVLVEDAKASKVFTILSALVQQHQYTDLDEDVDIKNKYLTVVGCGTDEVYSELVKMKSWTSMIASRFLRYYILYYYRPDSPNPVPDDAFPVPNIEVSKKNVEVNMDISELAKILSSQIPYDRCFGFVRKILAGHAMLSGNDVVTKEDIDWFKLYQPCLEVERAFKGEDVGKFMKLLYNVFKVGNRKLEEIADICGMDEEDVRFGLVMLSNKLKFTVKSTAYDIECPLSKRLKNLYEVYDEYGEVKDSKMVAG